MKNVVVTIAREFGSGGREIGRLVAERLGIPFYDKELVAVAARESGFEEKFIREFDEKRHTSLLYNLYMSAAMPSVYDQAQIAQANAIKMIAEKGPCVIVGRAADYVLQNVVPCVRVFIHAPIDQRIKRVQEEYGEVTPNPEQHVRKKDSERAAYYNFMSHSQWGKTENYHITFDSSIGCEKCAELLEVYVRSYMELDD